MFRLSTIAGTTSLRAITTSNVRATELLDVADAVSVLMNADLARAARLNKAIDRKLRWAAIDKLGVL